MRRLSVGRLVRSSYLLYFSQPAGDRVLWRAIQGRAIRSIVELGIGLGGRTERVLEVAAWKTDRQAIRYAGIDLFESRPAGQPALSLKRAHRELRATGAKVRLIPGHPYLALAQMANALVGADLVLIAAGQDGESLAGAWRYFPRMIHGQTLVFQQDAAAGAGQEVWRPVTHAEIEMLANAASRGIRRAA
jgi:hypothetical protein